MDEGLGQYITRIRELQPGIQIEAAVINNEGLANDVVVVNGETVFRFAKGEFGARALKNELLVLETVRDRIHLPVPVPGYTNNDVISYPFLRGEALTRTLLDRLNEPDRMVVMEQLATFLYDLHATPLSASLPNSTAPVKYQQWLSIRAKVEEKIYPQLLKHQSDWLNDLFNEMLDNSMNFAYTPRLIHGDLGCYHILFEPKTRRLSGVIDFGVAGIGDPANDLACLLQYYGLDFVRELAQWYPWIDEAVMKRARFYARGLELEWLLNGMESGEVFWFAAHLGNARGY